MAQEDRTSLLVVRIFRCNPLYKVWKPLLTFVAGF